MALINTIALTKGVKIEYERAKRQLESQENPSLFNSITTTIPSKSDREQYGLFGGLPVVREWLGEKKYDSFKDYDFTIINKDWEASLEVDRNEVEDDQVGMVMPKVQMLAQRTFNHKNQLLSNLLIDGDSDLAYDGTAFFANTHTDGTVDNLLAGTGTTDAQLQTDLTVARSAMMKFQDDRGEPLHAILDGIVCPPELEMAFRRIAESTTAVDASASGVVNSIGRTIKFVIADARLTDVDDWYGVSTSLPLNPLVFQDRKSSTLISQTAPTEEAMFNRRKMRFSVEARYNVGYGLFQLAIKTTN